MSRFDKALQDLAKRGYKSFHSVSSDELANLLAAAKLGSYIDFPRVPLPEVPALMVASPMYEEDIDMEDLKKAHYLRRIIDSALKFYSEYGVKDEVCNNNTMYLDNRVIKRKSSNTL